MRVMINDVGQRGHSLCLRNLLLVTGHDDSSIQGMYQYAYKLTRDAGPETTHSVVWALGHWI